jgi:hypothetical protein
MDKKSKWEVHENNDLITYDVSENSKKEYRYITIEEADAEDIKDSEFEISVIRKENRIGHESWGWSGNDKLTLPFDINTKEDYEWALKVADTIAEALNEKGL